LCFTADPCCLSFPWEEKNLGQEFHENKSLSLSPSPWLLELSNELLLHYSKSQVLCNTFTIASWNAQWKELWETLNCFACS
jgi:hypothetical protein